MLQSNPALQRTLFENTPVFDKLVAVTAPKKAVPPVFDKAPTLDTLAKKPVPPVFDKAPALDKLAK